MILVAMAMLVQRNAHADCTVQHKQARALKDTLASIGETTPEYRAMMLKRIQEAETAAANCDRAVADAKRSDEARAAARKREMEAEAKKDAEDRFTIDDMRSQAEFLRIAWSAYECSFEKERDDVLNNPFATADQKEALKRAEAMLTRVRATMKRGKIAQLSCRTEDVAKLAFCIADSSNAACGQPEMALRTRAENEIVEAVQLAPNPVPLTPTQKHAADLDPNRILQPKW